jgi:hypothetical protein
MSCATETYAAVGGLPTSLCWLERSDRVARPSVSESEIHRAGPPAPDGSRLTAAHVVPDTTKADPEHVWGDEGPVNE